VNSVSIRLLIQEGHTLKIALLVVSSLIFIGCSGEKTSENKVKKDVIKKEIVEKKVEKSKSKVLNDIVTVNAKASTKTGAQIYMKCAGCHGQSAEKSALGKSQVIKGWESSKVTTALNGYKAGTYGGGMKDLMKGQVTGLTDNDIKLVSEYISKL